MEFIQRLKNNLRSDQISILGLFLLALVVRLIALSRIYLISRDGIQYISLAQIYLSGSFFEGLSHPFHPLYPAIMALLGGVTGDFELAGKLVSLIFGSLTVIPLYWIGKNLYDSKVGLMGGFLFIFQPYCVRFSVDVLSDPTFLFFLVTSFYLGLKAGREGKSWWSLWAGILGGLAYLTRPEGVFIIFFLLVFYFLMRIFGHGKVIAKIFPITLTLFLGFALLAGPYIYFIKVHTGKWQISMKPSVTQSLKIFPSGEKFEQTPLPDNALSKKEGDRSSQVLAPEKQREPFQGGSIWRSIIFPLLNFIETYHYLLFLFLLFGIGSGIKREGQTSGRILLAFVVAYLLGLCYLYYIVSYVSRRHLIPPIVLSLPIAGLGFWEVQKHFSAWAGKLNRKWSRLLTTQATLILLLVTILTLTPKALKSQGKDKLPLKDAALWIKENCKQPSPLIMSNEPRVAYYAGGRHLYIPGILYEEFVDYVKAHQVDYLVFEERDMIRGEKFLSLLRPENFRKTPFKGGNEVVIYEVGG